MSPSSRPLEWSRSRLRRWLMLSIATGGLLAIVAAGYYVVTLPALRGSGELPCFASTTPTWAEQITPVVLSLCLWGIAAWMAFVARRGDAMPLWIASLTLSMAKLAHSGNDFAFRLYSIVLASAVPALFSVPFSLSQRRASASLRIVRGILSIIAFVVCLPAVVLPLDQFSQSPWYPTFKGARYLALAAAFLASSAIVIARWIDGRTESSRRKPRILAFGSAIAAGPIILLSVIPEQLGAPWYVPHEISMLSLALLGVFYADTSAITWRPLENRILYRFVSLYLLTLIFGTLFVMSSSLFPISDLLWETSWSSITALLFLVIILLYDPLYRVLESRVRWVWLGRVVRHDQEMERLIGELATVLDLDRLNQIITHDLAEVFDLSRVWLLINRDDPRLRPIASDRQTIGRSAAALPLEGALATYLQQHPAIHSRHELASAVEGSTRSLQENELLRSEHVELWIPLVSADTLQGIVLMGPKRLGDHYSEQDRSFLATLAHQAAITAQNARLMAQVRHTQKALAGAHREAIAAGERESKRLAQALHDGAIQQLLDANRQMGMLITPDTHPQMADTVRALRREIRDVVAQLRDYVGRLRPVGLDEMGLVPALLGHVASLRQTLDKAGPTILADMPDWVDLPEEDALCLFRIAQEAIRNATSHAQANTITVRLRERSHAVVLTVEDDGRGFAVPDPLTELAADKHFGLIIIAERAEQAGAEIEISSIPHVGTRVRVRMPIRELDTPVEPPTDAGMREPLSGE